MRRLFAAALVSASALGSCLPREPAGIDAHVPTTLFISATLTGTTVAMVVVDVTAPDIPIPLVFNIPTVDGVATGAITVPSGANRTLTMRAFDAGGVETHSGSVTRSIQPGTNPAIAIVLLPLTGSVPITVTLGSYSVTVEPAAATVAQGDTVHLAATVLDGDGNPVTGQVAWATLAPGVATVVSTGQQTARATGVAPGLTTIVAVFGGIAGPAAITVTRPFASGPLRVSTVNPRYFVDADGRTVYLTGSHTWLNFQDAGPSDPPPAFDWTHYLDVLEQHHHNFIKLWRWEAARWSAETQIDFWYDPMPYLRPGPGLALDGKPKFDLDQFNPAYFARMRQRVIEAGQRGIYVSIMLFNAWATEDKNMGNNNPWHGHPFNRDNNINGIDGDPNNDDEGRETQLMYPDLVARQEAYVRQVVDAVNDLDNVLYEISNESTGDDGGVKEWQYHMIDYVKTYEAGKPKQHPVGMTVFSPGDDVPALFASAAEWIGPNGVGSIPFDPLGNPAVADGSKVIIDDTDHLCGVCGEISWVWMSFLRGRNPIMMDPWDGANPVTSAPYDPTNPKWEEIRVQLGYARIFADRVNLSAMTPHGELASTGFCLAHVGVEYLVYLPWGGTVTMDLSSAAGTLTVEWFDPSTGLSIAGGTVTGGSVLALTTPTSGHAVLYLHQ